MFGDILSDEIAGLIGGLGLAPGGNIGDRLPAAIQVPLQDPNTGAADLGGLANTQQ